MSPIYSSVLGGAICGIGELFDQTDKLAKEERKQKDKDEDVQKIVVEINNSNGSITPVELKKKGRIYISPKGEHYKQLPTEEQLAPVYGL